MRERTLPTMSLMLIAQMKSLCFDVVEAGIRNVAKQLSCHDWPLKGRLNNQTKE